MFVLEFYIFSWSERFRYFVCIISIISKNECGCIDTQHPQSTPLLSCDVWNGIQLTNQTYLSMSGLHSDATALIQLLPLLTNRGADDVTIVPVYHV